MDVLTIIGKLATRRRMGAEQLDQTCATEDDSLCGGWLFVASWWFPTSCCEAVSLGEMPPQVSTSPLEE